MKYTAVSLYVESLSCKRITQRIFSCFQMRPQMNFGTTGRFHALQIVDLAGCRESRAERKQAASTNSLRREKFIN